MVVLGVMLVTALLSMFMSNTATTTVMAPLVVSLFASLNSNENGEEYDPNEEINITELTGMGRGGGRGRGRGRGRGEERRKGGREGRGLMDSLIAIFLLFCHTPNPFFSLFFFLTASMNEKEKIFLKAALLATAYSASVGGAATLIGTGTNLAFVAVYEGLFPLAPVCESLSLSFPLPLPLLLLPLFLSV